MRFVFPLLGFFSICLLGCAVTPSAEPGELPTQIGQMSRGDTTDLDAYETSVVRLLDHMEDMVIVLAHVETVDTSKHAAELIDEATPRFIRTRQQMADSEADREISSVGLVIRYAARYLRTSNGVERELRRIDKLGPEVFDPVKTAMLNLREGFKQAGLPEGP